MAKKKTVRPKSSRITVNNESWRIVLVKYLGQETPFYNIGEELIDYSRFSSGNVGGERRA